MTVKFAFEGLLADRRGAPFAFRIMLVLLVSIVAAGANPVGECPDDRPELPTSWQPRTPEQTLYAYVRCLNESSASIEMKIRWVKWQPDNSSESHCYVKCVCEDLRLYDPRTRQFVPERFELQARAFYEDSDDLAPMYADAARLLVGRLRNNECSTVFAKYAPFYFAHLGSILDIFHGDLRKILVTYQRLGKRVKQIGQSFVDYCEQRYGFVWAEEEVKPCPNRMAVDCILRGFRWITEEDTVNVAEIVRDYNGFVVSRSELERCQEADALYECLRAINVEALAGVIRERNLKTAYYFDQTSQEEPWKSAVEYGQSLLKQSPY